MNLRRFAVTCFAIAALVPQVCSADGKIDGLEKKYVVLAGLPFSAADLPRNCTIVEIPNEPQYAGFKNQRVTTEVKFFLVGDGPFKKVLDARTIGAVYHGRYQEKDDLGVVGWTFTSVEHAKTAQEAIAKSYANQPKRFRIWRSGDTVVLLIRDPLVGDECFAHFERHLSSRLK